MDFEYLYKYLLNLLAGLIFIILNLIYQPLNAKDLTYLSTLNPKKTYKYEKLSVGADVNYLIVNSENDYKDIFKKHLPGFNFYVGYNINGLMLEAGYSFSTRMTKEVTVANGSTFLGLPVNTNTIFAGKVRFKNTHLTLNFLTDLSNNVKVVTAAGVGFVRPCTFFSNNNAATMVPTTYPGLIEHKTTMVPRLGIGLVLCDNPKVNLRSMFYFEQYSRIRYKISPTPDQNKPFKNAYTVLIGVLFKL